jgi:ATP synthase protein I
MEQLARLQPLNRVLKWQLIALIVIAFFTVWWGVEVMVAAAFGALIAVTNTLLMRWHIQRAVHTAKADAEKNLSSAYRCVAERWLATIMLFAGGLGALGLDGFPLLSGFALTQLMLFLGNSNRA